MLLKKGVSIIGVDCAGVRNGKEHTPMDQHCADHGVFIVENLCNLDTLPSVEYAGDEPTLEEFILWMAEKIRGSGI